MGSTNHDNQKGKVKPFSEAVPSPSTKLRTRKQQVVRDALSESAKKLFLEHGFESVTVEQIAQGAGVSRRTFFRYYESKEEVIVEHLDRDDELFLIELASRPPDELPLLAIRNALIPAIEYGLQEPHIVRESTRLLRETSVLRRAVMERRNRFEERIAALMTQRLGTPPEDNTPILLAFLTRALSDSVFNSWYDNETDDIAGLVDDLLKRLYTIITDLPPEFKK